MKGKCLFLLILLLLIGLLPEAIGQKKDGDDQLKKADKLFESGQYSEAYPLYTHLLSMQKGNVDITFKYGATLLYGSDNKADAIPYLKKAAAKSTTDVRVHFFLGKAYQLNYEFNKAVKAYQDFKGKADAKVLTAFDVDQAIRQCENGKDLISNIKEVLVIEKKDVDSEGFFRYYELENLAGKILLAPESFQTSLDKKKGHIPIIYSAPLSNMVYFSSYGKSGDTGKDIYFVSRTGSGSWSDPVKLPAPVNSNYNEDFPFFHSDGKTLYFCSEGHNSMGGYDIFRSVFNPSTGSYTTPENLDFAINTPDDDFFYIADSLNQIAYFSSARASKQNRLDVYKVKVDLVPSNMIIIKGNFISELNPLLKDARITIEDEQTKRQVGIVNTDNKGNYLIDFKNGGQYNFYVEAGANGIVHTGRVEIPRLDYVAAFRQELIMIDDDGAERLMIKNYFDNPLDEEIEALTAQVLKKRAMLEVTPEDELAEKSISAKSAGADASFDKLYLSAEFIKTGTNEGVSKWADESVVKLKEVNEQYKSMAGVAFSESKVYDEKASQLILQAETKIRAYKYNKDFDKRIELLKEAIELRVEAEQNIMNASAALLLANKLSGSVQKRAVVIAELEKSSKIINNSIEEQDSESFEAEIANLNELDRDLKSPDRGLDKPVAYIESLKDNEVSEEKMQLAHAENLRNEKNATLALIRRLETQKNNAEEKEKESINIQLVKATENIEVIDKDNEIAWQEYRIQDRETQVAVLGSAFANEWEDRESDGLPEQESINRILAHVNNQQLALNQISEAENAALVALGVSAEEILTTEPSVLKTTIAANTLDKEPTKEPTTPELIDTIAKPVMVIEEELISGYEGKLNEAQSNSNEIDRLQETILLKQELLVAVNNEIESDAYSYNKTELNLLKTELSKEIDLLIVSFKTALDNQQTTFKEVTYYIPEYQQKLDEINKSDLTDLEKNLLQSEYLELVLVRLNNMLDSISLIEYDDEFIFTLRDIRENENSLGANISTVEAEIYRLQQEMELQSEIVVGVPTDKELIDMAYPAYADKKTLIDNNATYSDEEKATRLIQLNESLMAKLDAQIADLIIEKNTAQAEDIPIIDAKIVAINSIKDEKQFEISDAIALIATERISANEESKNAEAQSKVEEPVVLSTDEKSTMIATIDPGFATTYTLLMGSSKTQSEKLTEAINMHGVLSVSIDQKMASLNQDEEMLSNNAETARIAEELKTWEALSDEVSLEIESLNGQLDAIATSQPREESEILDDQTGVGSDITVATKGVAANPESWSALLTTAKTDAALNLWINQARISTDPGFKNDAIITEASGQSQRILHLNQLKEQQTEIDDKLKTVDKKEAKKLEKEQKQLTSEIESMEIELLSERTPLLVNEAKIRLAENEIEVNNKSVAKSYIQKTEAYLFQAKSSEGQEKLDFLKQAYQLGLMALQKSGFTELSAQLAREAGMEDFYAIADEPGLSYEEKKQFYSDNIQNLTSLEIENRQVMDRLNEEGVSESDDVWKEHEMISRTYRDAIVWNRLKLEELNDLQTEIEQNVIAQASDYEIAVTDTEFEPAMKEIGIQEAQIENIKENPELQAYYTMGWQEIALDKKISDLQTEKANFIIMAEASQNNAKEADVMNIDELSGEEAIVSYENQKKYNTEAIVWYEKIDSLDMVIAVLEVQKSDLVANRIAYHEKMQKVNKEAIIAIDSGLLVETTNQKPEQQTTGKPIEVVAEPVAVADVQEIDSAEANAEQPNDSADEPILIESEGTIVESIDPEPARIPITGFVFESGTSFYTDDEPIPVDPPLPTGVIFKVQIGAFRNPIPAEHFTGLTPLTAEKLDNGITRYTVGIFYDLPTAQMARAQVLSVGYNDAFIVAFLNGERISINRALGMLDGELRLVSTDDVSTENKIQGQNDKKEQQVTDGTNNESTVANETSSGGENVDSRTGLNQSTTTTSIDVEGEGNTELRIGYYNAPNAAPATEVESIVKMFYTVQVGVYSKPVSLGEIYNIQPLNVERTGLGYTRYTSGQFSDIIEAETHKEYVIDQGIVDAFITAYYQGRRISIAKAQTVMLTEPDAVRTGAITQFSYEEPLSEVEPDTTGSTPNLVSRVSPIDREEIIRNAVASDLRYVIYLGSYQDDIPNEVASALLEYSDAGIKRAINQGKTLYSTREMRSMYEAEEWLGRFREAGVDEARIIYVVSGEEITLEQTKEILDK